MLAERVQGAGLELEGPRVRLAGLAPLAAFILEVHFEIFDIAGRRFANFAAGRGGMRVFKGDANGFDLAAGHRGRHQPLRAHLWRA